MNKKVLAITASVVVMGLFSIALYLHFTPGAWFTVGRSEEGAVLVDSVSPDARLIASVIATDDARMHIFKVENLATGLRIAEKQIPVQFGYHKPYMSFIWSRETRQVTVIVDHDFGEGNYESVLSY